MRASWAGAQSQGPGFEIVEVRAPRNSLMTAVLVFVLWFFDRPARLG